MNKWELYDKDFKRTGIIINENEEIPDNLYHYSVNCWVINSKNQLLLLKKTINYNLHYPGFWNGINGNVHYDETPKETCIKSVYSKIGIKVDSNEIKEVDIKLRDPYHYIYETYIVKKDIDLNDVKFVDKTSTDAKWIDLKELYNMIENGEIAWVMIPRIEKYVVPLIK